MIAYLNGKVLDADNGTVVLEVGGVGYEIVCSASAYVKLATAGKGEVYTYLSVREDGVSLFGFDSIAEKKMFLKLISVSGVGPKMGITVLSGMNLNDLAIAIASSDTKSLSKIKGLGKKTAERIILELREAVSAVPVEKGDEQLTIELGGESENAVLALMSLGYSRAESTKAVNQAVAGGAKKLEEIITASLRLFA